MKLDTIKDWVSKAQIKIWLVLGCITAVGAAGSLWHQDIPWSWLAHLAGALSPPLFTAGILGLTVDIFLKRELARDVFVAAFRYILPDELKEEVQRIISYKFLCIDSTTIVSISAPSNDIVRVEIKHERTFKNITGHTEPFYGTFAVDEWGFSQKSEILECRLEIGETKIDDADDNPDYEGKKDAIGKKTKSVSVKSGNTIKSITKGFEIHRPNGELHMQFSYPSRRPKVRVETPSGFSHSCTFGIPDEKVIRSSISQDYTLDGTQFPGQHTRVRWWPDCGMRLSQSTSSIVGFCVIAALMGFSLAAHAEDVRKSKPILPPPEYDSYYPGGFVVFTVPTHSELVRMCGQKHEPFPSCSGKDAKGTCVILALPRDEISALGYSYDAVKRHEFGHCNGWPADHPGMRAAADDTSPEKCSCFRTEEKTIQCNLACNQPAGPDIVAALRERFPDLQGSAAVFDTFIDGNHDYVVAFGTTSGTMSCRLKLNPIKLDNCRIRHQ